MIELVTLPDDLCRELADLTRKPDRLAMMSYLSQIYECFKKEIPAVSRSHTMGSHHNQSDDDLLMDAHNNMVVNKRESNRPATNKTRSVQKNPFLLKLAFSWQKSLLIGDTVFHLSFVTPEKHRLSFVKKANQRNL